MPTFAKSSAVAASVLLLGAGVALAGGNTLSVVSPGMNGTNFKLRVTFNNDDNQVWVEDKTPVCEETINVDWWHTTPGLIFDADDRIDSLLVKGEQADPGGGVSWLRCRTQVGNGATTNNIRCSYRRENGSYQFAGTAGFNPNFEHSWRVEIIKDSVPGFGTGDGVIRFFKDPHLDPGGEPVFVREFADNFNACFSAERMGTSGILTADTVLMGVADFDEFISTR